MGKGTDKTEHGKAASVTTLERCVAQGCKSGAHRFSFCDEHYEHFKFGLIKKTGEQVSDYDKKFGHYTAWKESVSARKAA